MVWLGRLSIRSNRAKVATRIPASAEQQRLWLHASMEPELPIYNESVTVHRRGSFDPTALEASFSEILRRHEAWRTSFEVERNELLQIVHPAWRIELPVIDLRGLAEERREEEACRLASEDAALAFDMQRGPLFRVRVLRLADDHHWLQLTLHHIIFDGTSIYRVFVPELAKLYAGQIRGEGFPPAAPALQYADYATWQEKRLQSTEIERQLDFWRTELSGEIPVLRLPFDRATTGSDEPSRGNGMLYFPG